MASSDSDEESAGKSRSELRSQPLSATSFTIDYLLKRPEPSTCVRTSNIFVSLAPKQICPVPPNIVVPRDLFERDRVTRRMKKVKDFLPDCSPIALSLRDSMINSQTCQAEDSDDSSTTPSAKLSPQDADTDATMDEGCHRYKKKRPRTAFSVAQIRTLETEFERNRYLTGSKRKELSKQLKLSETQIKIWFQNRRTKLKRKNVSEMESWVSELYSPLGPMAPRPLVIGDQLYLFNTPTHEGAALTLPMSCLNIHQHPRSYGPSWPTL